MAAAIEGICGDAAWRRQLEQSARRRAEEAFDIRTAAASLVKHYRDVLECGGKSK
jgi:glycosyltransferase involved in cell wall biosynthesis